MTSRLVLAITLSSLMTLPAIAQMPGPGGHPPRRGGNDLAHPPGGPEADARIAAYLGLSDEQKAQWTAIRQSRDATLQSLHTQARDAHDAVDALLKGGSNDACAIGTAALAARTAHDKVTAAQDALDRELAAILTAEQNTKLAALRAAGEAGHPGHDGPPPPPRP